MFRFLAPFISLIPTKTLACELALVLAVDVSGSVDAEEYDVQMKGLAEAFRDAAISEALVVSEASVLLLQWTGTARQKVSVPWTHIRGFDDTDKLADDIANAPRLWRNFATAIGEALILAESSFDAVDHCERKVIDVSGDGKSNEGIEPYEVHPRLAARGIIVNGLAIEATDQDLTTYFRQNLILGPGSFALRASDFEDYPIRIRQKLLREITKQLSGLGEPRPKAKL